MSERAVVFDVMGTLFDLSPLQQRLQRVGAPPAALEAWFGRLLHTAASLTLVGEFRPFAEIASATLRSQLAQLDVDPERAPEVLAGLAELDPFPEAADALAQLARDGIRMIALTNGGAENTSKLLARGGLDRYVAQVVTTEEVRAYKPHPAPYRRALEALALPAARVTLVAAHGWDVVGARSAGLDAVWVDRLERIWPLPLPEPRRATDLVAAAAAIVGDV